MTDKIQQARRELFEAWTKIEHCDLTRRQDGEYFDDLTHGAWLGFNAALDLAVIELPEYTEEVRQYGYSAADVHAAIESTNLGIKVK